MRLLSLTLSDSGRVKGGGSDRRSVLQEDDGKTMGVAPLCERRDSTKVWGGNDVIGWSISDIAGVHLGDSQITVTRMAAKGTAVPVVTHAGWAPYDPSASEKDIAGVIKELWRSARVSPYPPGRASSMRRANG